MPGTPKTTVSKSKTLTVYILTVVIGYALFIIPGVFFGVTKINGGKTGVNLLYTALFQLFSIPGLLYLSLRTLKKDFRYIGLRFEHFLVE